VASKPPDFPLTTETASAPALPHFPPCSTSFSFPQIVTDFPSSAEYTIVSNFGLFLEKYQACSPLPFEQRHVPLLRSPLPLPEDRIFFFAVVPISLLYIAQPSTVDPQPLSFTHGPAVFPPKDHCFRPPPRDLPIRTDRFFPPICSHQFSCDCRSFSLSRVGSLQIKSPVASTGDPLPWK